MQDLNDMVSFAEVVDRGWFAAAGRSLGVPKSRLSRPIGELEARLGVRLLQRTTRKLSLTEAGEIYHRHCVAVRVTCPVHLAQTTLGPILPRFIAAHPQVRIEMQVTNRVVDLVPAVQRFLDFLGDNILGERIVTRVA